MASSGSDTETLVASRPSSQQSTAGLGSASAQRARSFSSTRSTLQTDEQRPSTSDDNQSERSTGSSEGENISPQTVAKPGRGMQWRWRKPPWWKFRSGRANIIDSRRDFINRELTETAASKAEITFKKNGICLTITSTTLSRSLESFG